MKNKLSVWKNKKGSWVDLIFIVIIIFAFIVISIVAKLGLSSISTGFNESGNLGDESYQYIADSDHRMGNVLDGIFLMVVFGLVLAIVFGVFVLKVHPAFFFIAFILLILLGVVFIILSDAFGDVTDSEPLYDTRHDNFPIMNYILENFVGFFIGLSVLIAVLLYAKWKGVIGGGI